MSIFSEEISKIETRYNLGDVTRQFEKLKNNLMERPVVFYGAGVLDIYFLNFFLKNNLKVECFCDSNKTGVHNFSQLPIITPQQLKENYSNANIVITAFKYRNEIASALKEAGFTEEQLFTEVNFFVEMLSFDEAKAYFPGWEWAYNFFGDDISKNLISNIIKSYLFGDRIPYSSSQKYFEKDLLSFSDNETFVDAGLFNGDTTEEFIRQRNSKYQYIYGFEPDAENLDKAKNKLKPFQNIKIIPHALWNKEGTFPFYSRHDGGSRLLRDNDTGINNSVAVTLTMDTFFSSEPRAPSFIKLSTEGSENEILLGSQNIIQKYKPKLAVSVYHNPSDIYEITNLIYNYNNRYHFFLRHYSEYIYDTILYAFQE